MRVNIGGQWPQPGGQPDSAPRTIGRGRTRSGWVVRGLLAATVVVAVGVAADLGGALAGPSQDSAAARVAEWARTRGLGGLVSWAEWAAYQLDPPPLGGVPSGGIPMEGAPAARTVAQGGPCDGPPMTTPAGTPLPGEGVWQPIERVGGRNAILVTFVRPDSSHTRFLAGITCTDQQVARFSLHPGTQLPGGSGWAAKPTVAGALGRLLATFNSGFLMRDAGGGFWLDGKSSGSLVAGQASMVFTADGRLDVRSWEGGSPNPGIVAVRQNLVLLVDNGQVTDAVRHADSGAFGKTLGDSAYVWRSGVGIRADGSIVTVHGNALSVATLAALLRDAGAVRAMQLDINRDWTSYIYYRHVGGSVRPHKLTSDEVRAANRYLQDSTRDFVAVEWR